MKNLILFLITTILFTNCTKPIPINIPQQESKLVINSQLIPNQYIIVNVSKSFTSLKDLQGQDTFLNQLLVDHALVTINDGQVYDTLKAFGNGFYVSLNTNFINNKKYFIKVFDSISGLEASANTTIKNKIGLDSYTTEIINDGIDSVPYLNYTIKDNPNEKNYYFVSVTNNRDVTNSLGLPSNLVSKINANSILFLHNDSDADANGIITNKQSVFVDYQYQRGDTVTINIANIEEGYFKYLSAFKKNGNVITQLTGEPINYPTNVINGYGYFTGHTPSFYTSVFK